MKITIRELKKIIREEIQKQSLREGKFTSKRLLDLCKKYHEDSMLIQDADGNEYAIYADDIDPKEDSVFGMPHRGKEKEIDVKDISFVSIKGKRITS
jgi:hypothetical protein